MKTLFEKKSSNILVLDPSAPMRLEIISALRQAGFESINPVGTVAEAKRALSSAPFAWVLSTLLAVESENTVQLLKHIAENTGLQNVSVSILMAENERSSLPLAYQFGLLSWHEKNLAKNALQTVVKEVQDAFVRNHYDKTLVAAQFFRKYLRAEGLHRTLLTLEESLISAYQSAPRLLLSLAEAQFLNERGIDAMSSLYQAKVLDPSLTKVVDELQKKYLESPTQGGRPGIFKIARCVIIDPDESVHAILEPILTEIGAKEVMKFQDGESAWAWLQENKEVDLIIHEWRVPKLNGFQFIQRLRAEGFSKVPVIVLSSLVKEDDALLLSEMFVANVVPKPVDRKRFALALSWVLQQAHFPSEQKSLEQKIFQLLGEKKFDEAEKFKAMLYSNPKLTASRKKYIDAEFLFHREKYNEAKDAVINAIKLADNDTLATTNLLGKCLLKLGETDTAVKFLEKARSICPKNIARLCMLAEAEAQQGHVNEAKLSLEEAKALDPTASLVVETEFKIALAEVDVTKARDLMSKLQNIDNIVAYMNNSAVAKIRARDIEGGIEVYKHALAILSYDKKDVRGVINYNLALAYLRLGNVEGALPYAATASSSESNIAGKAQPLLKRIKDAVSSGGTLLVASRQNQASSSEADLESLIDVLESYGGESTAVEEDTNVTGNRVCLFPIFKNKEPLDEFSAGLLNLS